MKSKKYNIDEYHQAVVEIDGNNVILYIETITKILFNLIKWHERVTSFSVFTMSDKDDDRGIEIERWMHGYLGRYGLNYRKIETFDINVEIEKLFNSYQINIKRKKQIDDRLNSFIKTL